MEIVVDFIASKCANHPSLAWVVTFSNERKELLCA